MDNLNLISNFAEFKELKNIDKSTMIGVLEDVFRHALQKQYETDENFDVIINPEKGDLEIWRNRTVVEDDAVEDPNAQISVSEVKAIDPTYEIGDEYADEIKLSSFGRRAVLSLRQNLASRILDLEKASLYEKYSEKVGEIVTGEVYQVWKKEGYRNVYLEDYSELKMEIAELDSLIDDLSIYMQSTGKKYADHAATLRSWSARKRKQQKPGTGIPDYTYNKEESL